MDSIHIHLVPFSEEMTQCQYDLITLILRKKTWYMVVIKY
jgi:hypothetical protein